MVICGRFPGRPKPDFTVIGVFDKRPSVGNLGTQQDDFVVVPQTTHQTMFGSQARRGFRGQPGSAMIAVLPFETVTRDQALDQVRAIMRIRHGLTLDQPDDFDVITQDAALQVWDQVSQATQLGLIVISSIALMVGGIGVMAIMTISVTERTREIGVRKALGARRRDILGQFLAEAIVLTAIGGILGIVMMRLVIGQLLAIVERYPPLVDGAFVIIAWVGTKLCLEYFHEAGYIALEIPRWFSLTLIVVIFAVAFVYAKLQGPVEDTEALAEQAGILMEAEGAAISRIDGDVTK